MNTWEFIVGIFSHVGQIDQIDHDPDHLDPNLPLTRDTVQELYSTDPTKHVLDHAGDAVPTRQLELDHADQTSSMGFLFCFGFPRFFFLPSGNVYE